MVLRYGATAYCGTGGRWFEPTQLYQTTPQVLLPQQVIEQPDHFARSQYKRVYESCPNGRPQRNKTGGWTLARVHPTNTGRPRLGCDLGCAMAPSHLGGMSADQNQHYLTQSYQRGWIDASGRVHVYRWSYNKLVCEPKATNRPVGVTASTLFRWLPPVSKT